MAPTDKTKKTAAKKKGEPTADPKQAKLSALTAAMERIEKTYGRGAIMKLGDDNITDVDVIPSADFHADVLPKSTVRNHPARQLLPSTP